jgi:tripartite-type tricarboxylate transporter receptor subunit TctC
LHLAAGAAALPAVTRIARAQAYPPRPVRLMVGFPPGGGADTTARIIAPWLSQRLGQPVVIENRPGASSTLAAQAVVNSPPDGHALLSLGGAALMATLITGNLLHVPYRGGAPMVTDLVGGQVQVVFDVMVTSLPHIRSAHNLLAPVGNA